MADVKEYGYFLKGNKIAIVEKDTSFDNDVNSKDYGPGANRSRWKSPLAAVDDGLEVEYTYVPDYTITDTTKVDTNITAYKSNNGYLEISDATSSYTNYGDLSGYNIADGNYIVLRNAGSFSGLHQVDTKSATNSTNDTILLKTKYSGSSTAWTNFDATVSLYYYVDVLNNESDELHIRPYQVKALECYVRAKLAMDVGNIEIYEYYMKEFRKKLEKEESGKIWGARMTAVGPHGIR